MFLSHKIMMFRGEAGVPLHWTVSNPKPDCKKMLTIKIVPPPAVLGELGPGQLGPGQLGPGLLGPGQLGP